MTLQSEAMTTEITVSSDGTELEVPADRLQRKEIIGINENGQEGENEIQINLNAEVPLSKKQRRLEKKGKLNKEKFTKKYPAPKSALEEESHENKENGKRSKFGVWIGNMSYDTTKDDLKRFIIHKTSQYEDNGDSSYLSVKEADFLRINIPKKANKKGFAYVDLPSEEHMRSVISLSESILNGRNLLIKSSNSFEGRPQENQQALTRILFVGNLSYDTTEDLLTEHFRHCGDIQRIRMATFEDSGKCKGFAFVDFMDESGPSTALKSKFAKRLINRTLRLEYGEDRSKKAPQRKRAANHMIDDTDPDTENTDNFSSAKPRDRVKADSNRKRKSETQEEKRNKRQSSSVALANATRESAAIVPSTGKKISFDT